MLFNNLKLQKKVLSFRICVQKYLFSEESVIFFEYYFSHHFVKKCRKMQETVPFYGRTTTLEVFHVYSILSIFITQVKNTMN
jgi:hypothetical protein